MFVERPVPSLTLLIRHHALRRFPVPYVTTGSGKRLNNIENVLQNPLKIDLKSIKKRPQIHLKGSLGPLWAPKGCHRNEGVFLGPLFFDFCSILETLWAPIFDPFDHLWAIGAPLDPSWEGSEKATVFLSLWEPPQDLPIWRSYSK